jgi:hypothetical protein
VIRHKWPELTYQRRYQSQGTAGCISHKHIAKAELRDKHRVSVLQSFWCGGGWGGVGVGEEWNNFTLTLFVQHWCSGLWQNVVWQVGTAVWEEQAACFIRLGTDLPDYTVS